MKKSFVVLSFALLINQVNSQIISNPLIGKSPTLSNCAKRTGLLSTNRIDIKVAQYSTDTILSPVVSLVNPEPKIEQYFNKSFESFKETASLIYEEDTIGLRPRLPVPFGIVHCFDGWRDNSQPLDNSIACSDNNNLVCLSNKSISFWKENSLRYSSSLAHFIDYEISSPCDPKVYYDPTARRFILFLQTGTDPHKRSELILAFSLTDDPLDGWNFYKVSGNPLNRKDHWFDYPKIGISEDGLFISGNIYSGPAVKGRFIQSVVYQFDKKLGFNGENLLYRVWYDISESPFTIVPVNSAAKSLTCKGIFMICVAQNASNFLQLYNISSDIYDENSRMDYYRINTEPYRFFAYAYQFKIRIDNGDLRMQDAIYYDNKIFSVFTSGNIRNFSRVNFNILDISTLTTKSELIGDELNTSYAFPSLNLITTENDKPLIILQYNGTSNNSYPDIRCKACDDDFNCSEEVIIKSGESLITNSGRWGDYSCIARNYDKNQIWLSSSYGKNQISQTNISCITALLDQNVSRDTFPIVLRSDSKNIDFTIDVESEIRVMLSSDRYKTTIYEGKAQKGMNKLEIITDDLDKGNYRIDIINSKNGKSIARSEFSHEF
jgi:hypothetical protein